MNIFIYIYTYTHTYINNYIYTCTLAEPRYDSQAIVAMPIPADPRARRAQTSALHPGELG